MEQKHSLYALLTGYRLKVAYNNTQPIFKVL